MYVQYISVSLYFVSFLILFAIKSRKHYYFLRGYFTEVLRIEMIFWFS